MIRAETDKLALDLFSFLNIHNNEQIKVSNLRIVLLSINNIYLDEFME